MMDFHAVTFADAPLSDGFAPGTIALSAALLLRSRAVVAVVLFSVVALPLCLLLSHAYPEVPVPPPFFWWSSRPSTIDFNMAARLVTTNVIRPVIVPSDSAGR